jgi:hypothetical protein
MSQMTVEPDRGRELAAEVGDAYLTSGRGPDPGLVIAAYDQLRIESDRLFEAAARRTGPRAVRIVFTRCREPYASDRELVAAARSTRVLEITTAAIEPGRIHPLLGCEFGGPFDRFRAMHDLIGHVGPGYGFGLADELAAWRTQDRLHGRLAGWALATEILGVNSARSILSEPPELKAILFDRGLLTRARAVLGTSEPSVPRAPGWR